MLYLQGGYFLKSSNASKQGGLEVNGTDKQPNHCTSRKFNNNKTYLQSQILDFKLAVGKSQKRYGGRSTVLTKAEENEVVITYARYCRKLDIE